MNEATIVLYFLLFVANLLIATEWAKYGFLEVGIQRPFNKRALAGLFIGTLSLFYAVILDDHYGITFYEGSYKNYVLFTVLGVPVVWLFFYRYVLESRGIFDLNRALIRTKYWSLGNYRPGKKNDEERAKNLREFGFAQGALRSFRKAIELQKRGDMVRRVERCQKVTDDCLDYQGGYAAHCPVCSSKFHFPKREGHNFSGVCDLCGSFLTARIEGDNVFLAADLTKPIHSPNDGNRYRTAVAYRGMAWLYRMMNMFDDSLAALRESNSIIDKLLDKHPREKNYLALKSLIVFGEAEINHALRNTEEARKKYQESLSLDSNLGNEEGVRVIQFLLNEL